jgi:hypothetical protein
LIKNWIALAHKHLWEKPFKSENFSEIFHIKQNARIFEKKKMAQSQNPWKWNNYNL